MRFVTQRPWNLVCKLGLCLGLLLAFRSSPATSSDDGKLPLKDRVRIASQIYNFVQTYFGHWRGVPDLDLDREFNAYLDQILPSDNRLRFDLASMELIAKLKNGHSGFDDSWLRKTHGARLNFYAYPIAGEWVVSQSEVQGLQVGDVIEGIDGQSFEAFYNAQRKYISASDGRWARRSFLEHPYLFPVAFSLEVRGGRKISVTRHGEFRWPGSDAAETTVIEQNGVVTIRIPSFAEPKFEAVAVKAVQDHRSARAIIFDVRSNHGGSSPNTLVGALMLKPYHWFAESTPVSIGLFRYQGDLGNRADISWYGDTYQPAADAYKGDVYVLVDGGCFSACEDFLVSIKETHRATIIGERTAGSSGQPAGKALGDGMFVGVSTKREYFQNGELFEGVGIAPDVEVRLTAADLRTGNDPVTRKALDLIQQRKAR